MYGLKQVARSQITEHQSLGEQALNKSHLAQGHQPVSNHAGKQLRSPHSQVFLLYPLGQAINDLLVQLHLLLCSFKDEVLGKCFLQREIYYGYFPGYEQRKATQCPCGKEQERDRERKWLTLSFLQPFKFLSPQLLRPHQIPPSSPAMNSAVALSFLLSLTVSLQVMNSLLKQSEEEIGVLCITCAVNYQSTTEMSRGKKKTARNGHFFQGFSKQQ